MTIARFASRLEDSRGSTNGLIALFASACAMLVADVACAGLGGRSPRARLEAPFVVTQLPARADAEKYPPCAGGMLRAPYGDRGRLVLVSPHALPRVLTGGFHGACDPEISFDAKQILFAGKRKASDHWNIYEMAVDGSGVRQITSEMGNCRSPGYQSSLYRLRPVGVPSEPEYHLTFVSDAAGTMNEDGSRPATDLYCSRLDGSAVRRLTFNLSSDMDPVIMSDGRLVFSGWQRARLDHGLLGRVGLFGVNIDGADCALYAGYEGRRIKHMPCATESGLVVFVEADAVPWDGAGQLSCVRIRRPLHSYRQITRESDGLFHSPSPLPGGRILVSRRPRDGSRTHGVWRLDPSTGKAAPVFDDPRYHEIQARLIHPRTEPDGRSSVVTEKDPHGKLYCLNVYTSDLEKREWMPVGSVKRLRVLEGVPLSISQTDAYLSSPKASARPAPEAAAARYARYPGSTVNGVPPLVQRRILGEISVQDDGSFNVEIPANTPIELQILDGDGMALRSCGWIWARNREPRGCIGCHEDAELVPENRFVDAMRRSPVSLCLPPERRRTVDFRRDVMPIVARKCAPCHRRGETPLYLDGDLTRVAGPGGNAHFNRTYENLLVPDPATQGEPPFGRYVHPGRARTSPLVWHVFGRDTSRPWDPPGAQGPVKKMPPAGSEPLTEDQRRTIVEWIDMGALWDGIPGADNFSGMGTIAIGEGK